MPNKKKRKRGQVSDEEPHLIDLFDRDPFIGPRTTEIPKAAFIPKKMREAIRRERIKKVRKRAAKRKVKEFSEMIARKAAKRVSGIKK